MPKLADALLQGEWGIQGMIDEIRRRPVPVHDDTRRRREAQIAAYREQKATLATLRKMIAGQD
jgi:hypothetical protein